MLSRQDIIDEISLIVDDTTKRAFAYKILTNRLSPPDALWLWFKIRNEIYINILPEENYSDEVVQLKYGLEDREKLGQHLYDVCKNDNNILEQFLKLDIEVDQFGVNSDVFIGEL